MSGFLRLAPWPLYYRQSLSVFVWPIQASALQWRCFLWEVSGICLVWHRCVSSAIASTNVHMLALQQRGLYSPKFGDWGGEMQSALGLLLPGCPGRGLWHIAWCFTVGFQRMLLKSSPPPPWFGHHLCKGCSMLATSAVQTPRRHWRIPAIPQPGWERRKNEEIVVVMFN